MDGLDEELEPKETETVVPLEQKKKRQPFAYWDVGGESHRMKLTASMVCKLEDKYKMNLLGLLAASDGMPQLSVMLTIIQGAMIPWEHGVSFSDVQKMYDQYCEEGGNQMKLMQDVFMQVLTVSGFFTENQAENLAERMAEAENMM